MIFNTISLYYLAFRNALTPIYFSMLFIVHFTILLFTKFNEENPGLGLLLCRHYESMICYFLPFLYIAYILTLITDSSRSNPAQTALIFVKFSLIIYFWVVFSSIPFLGIYFSISILTHVVGVVIRFFPGYDPPVVLYFTFFFQFLWGLGYWYSHTHFVIRMIRKREDLGHLNDLGKWISILLSLLLIGIGLWLIFNENSMFSFLHSLIA